MINFHWYQFSELTNTQLYAILMLRSEVFVVEQSCAYLDPDGLDPQAIHLLGTQDNQVLAYLRIFLPSELQNDIVFGRVVTAKTARNQGYARLLLQELLNYCTEHFAHVNIRCSAQHYLQAFYEDFGFKAYGSIYLEDGIPHIHMQLDQY